MFAKKTYNALLVLLCVSMLSGGLPGNIIQSPEEEKEEYLQELSRIQAMRESLNPQPDREAYRMDPDGYIKQLMASRDKNDLDAYEKFTDAILNIWASKNPEYFGRLTLALCAELGGGTFKDDRCYELRRQYALLALEKGSTLSVVTELELTGLVTSYAPKREDFALRRKKDIDVRLRAWRRLLVAIDPTWDPDEVVGVYPDPPRGLQYWVNGMDPNAIGDPIIRAEYKAALAAKQQKIEEYVEQNRLHKWLERYPKYIESYMISNYSRPPYNSEELKQMLDASALGEERQTHILETVTRNIEAARLSP